jgi:hypothetical protein
MKTADLTDKQRQVLAHVERARNEGTPLSEYAKAHGVSARAIYDGMAALRRKGVLPRGRASSKSGFVAVRVASSVIPVMHTAPRSTMLCRMVLGRTVIECGEWPPTPWLLSLASGYRDAAT